MVVTGCPLFHPKRAAELYNSLFGSQEIKSFVEFRVVRFSLKRKTAIRSSCNLVTQQWSNYVAVNGPIKVKLTLSRTLSTFRGALMEHCRASGQTSFGPPCFP